MKLFYIFALIKLYALIVVFDKKYLRDFYEFGRNDDKKHRFQPQVIKSYKRGIDYLKQVKDKEELFYIKSLHFEALRGEKRGLFSIRAGLQYRIEFTIKESLDDSVLTICNIIELSNHYE